MSLLSRFKPQRGKFTQKHDYKDAATNICFKPQRGKFTLVALRQFFVNLIVSNPNGVNLHNIIFSLFIVNLRVSNPNGVNLHPQTRAYLIPFLSFKPQRGKFTQHQNTHI